ncbi:MAG: TonB-dependent receptor plug domain-containing protein [Chitinophagales bacterium]|nr:TonB-dependent receptor plug domain-containing protein [Chitinophagales bacterium]
MRNLFLLLLLTPITVFSQEFTGKVSGSDGTPLTGANVHWIGTTIGTSTDLNGQFSISLKDVSSKVLVLSYVGYRSDTIDVSGKSAINIQLVQAIAVNEVEITADRPDAHISSVIPIKTEVITKEELTKAACCDLAGCFNTQASVQPTTTNIVTNSKELRILGLSGVYNQVLVDGMPLIQGLSYTYGVSAVPGTLVDNIYVAKGANSVLQGYESISGQINVELKDPKETDKLLLNAYINSFRETQFNVNYAKQWNGWSTLLAAHTTQPAGRTDRDGDNFLDLPLLSRYSVYNKWKYGSADETGWHSMIALRYVNERRIGGQVDFDLKDDEGTMNNYGQTLQYSQPEFYTRSGYRLNDQHNIVLFASTSMQDQESYFGTTMYNADQLNTNLNVQHELLWKDKHELKTGLSYRYFDLDEEIAFGTNDLGRTYGGTYSMTEHIPGVYAENLFQWKDNSLVLITGIRLDHHNEFGWFASPRALLKYDIGWNTTARISVGTGWRTVKLFSENINLLASSRDVVITEEIEPERALNYGVNLVHKIFGENVESQLSLDFYRTQFQNQVFPDYDSDPAIATISNFTGRSISNSFQAEVGLEFFERAGSKISYNYLDVYRIVDGEKLVLPFNSKHRITGTFSYKPMHQKWHLDMSLHWYGKQRVASTYENLPEDQQPDLPKPYTVVDAQFTKSWNRFEVYGGVENIFDFRQKQPIQNWESPFDPYFDTSTVWGPTKGREAYIGLRFRIE